MIAGLDDHELVALDGVDEAVFLVDAPGPEAGQITGEAFRLAGAGSTAAKDAELLVPARVVR